MAVPLQRRNAWWRDGVQKVAVRLEPPLGSRSRYGEMLSGSAWPGQERNEAKGQHRPAEEQREPSRHGGRSGIFGQRKNYRRRWCDEQTGTRKLAGRSQIDLILESSMGVDLHD
jgi:hypothetical protein